MKLSFIKTPNTFLLIFSLLTVVAIATWIIPGGKYHTTEKNGRTVVIANSFEFVPANPQGIDDLLMSPIKGFVDAALIIGFVLLVGGAFSVFQRTKAVDAAIHGIASAHKKNALVRMLLIPIFMLIFSSAGAIFGMSEEVIPFILVFVPLALMLGYDSITGVAIPFVGAGTGFAGAFLNPFTVGIAQGIADVPLFSGIEYRIIVWLIVTSIAIAFVMKYAAKVKRNPELSLMYEKDLERRKKLHIENKEEYEGLTSRHKLVLIVFFFGISVLIFGVLKYHWYIEEIAAVFFGTGILVGVVGGLKMTEITDSFVSGAKDLIGTALVIALARSILVIAKDGYIIDTMLYYISNVISVFHPIISSQMMFIAQSFLNFFVPSGSGQAALTMPIMAPLSDLVGVTRQTAVLAFQFGDGFTTLMIPTSAVTMGVLTLAEIPWEKWLKWIIPLQILFFIAGLLLLIPPYLIGWQ